MSKSWLNFSCAIKKPGFRSGTNYKNSMLVVLCSVALFFSHIIALGFSSLLAVSYIFGANYKNYKMLLIRIIPYFATLPLIMYWYYVTYIGESRFNEGRLLIYDNDLLGRWKDVLIHLAGVDYYPEMIFIPAVLFVGTIVIVFPIISRCVISLRPERWLPLVVGGIVFFAFPDVMSGTAFIQPRLGVFLAPLWFMIWDPPKKQFTRWDWLPIIVVLFLVLNNIVRYTMYAKTEDHFDKIITAMEPGERALSMIVERSSQYSRFPIYLNFPLWYQAEKKGIVDFNFAIFYPEMVRHRWNRRPKADQEFMWNPRIFDWDAHRGGLYKYFVVRAKKYQSVKIFKKNITAVSLVTHSGAWWLYERKE